VAIVFRRRRHVGEVDLVFDLIGGDIGKGFLGG
jgi:hypothetical protein